MSPKLSYLSDKSRKVTEYYLNIVNVREVTAISSKRIMNSYDTGSYGTKFVQINDRKFGNSDFVWSINLVYILQYFLKYIAFSNRLALKGGSCGYNSIHGFCRNYIIQFSLLKIKQQNNKSIQLHKKIISYILLLIYLLLHFISL